ncbi:nuclear transport factor 2 family protein [Amycolatopsis sp. NPDC005961]|uniref:nuclear transport factor 2 family protein n=1 Tax=Amycolatopsis sp. NPDC005961 TaxID=3156720 RepID=UPI0033DE9B9B
MNRSLRLAVPALTLALAATTAGAIAHAQPETTVHIGQSTGSRTSVPRVAQDWIAGWNSPDPDRLARLFTTDATYTDNAVGVVWHGRTGVADWKRRTDQFIPGVQLRLVNAFRDGDDVAIQAVYSGRITGAPRPFLVPATAILKLRHGLIATDTDYYNLAAVLAQSGLPADWTPPGS